MVQNMGQSGPVPAIVHLVAVHPAPGIVPFRQKTHQIDTILEQPVKIAPDRMDQRPHPRQFGPVRGYGPVNHAVAFGLPWAHEDGLLPHLRRRHGHSQLVPHELGDHVGGHLAEASMDNLVVALDRVFPAKVPGLAPATEVRDPLPDLNFPDARLLREQRHDRPQRLRDRHSELGLTVIRPAARHRPL